MLMKKFRITKDNEFSEFFGKKFKDNKGRNFSTANLVLKVFNNKLENPRFGLMVSNKVDKRAVIRNRIRRQIRELLRLRINEFKEKYDCLFVVQKGTVNLTRDQLQKEVLSLLEKARLL